MTVLALAPTFPARLALVMLFLPLGALDGGVALRGAVGQAREIGAAMGLAILDTPLSSTRPYSRGAR